MPSGNYTERPAEPEVVTISTSPGSVLAVTARVLRDHGGIMNLRHIVTGVQRHIPHAKRNTVQTALSRLVKADRAEHVGDARSGDYRWLK